MVRREKIQLCKGRNSCLLVNIYTSIWLCLLSKPSSNWRFINPLHIYKQGLSAIFRYFLIKVAFRSSYKLGNSTFYNKILNLDKNYMYLWSAVRSSRPSPYTTTKRRKIHFSIPGHVLGRVMGHVEKLIIICFYRCFNSGNSS